MKVIHDGGEVIELGETEATPTISIIDYSTRETDEFGVTTVVPRAFARRMAVRLVLPFDQVDEVQRRLAAIRARPVQWIADERYASLNFRGIYKEFETDHAVPPVSYCTLTVDGIAASEPFIETGGDPAPNGHASSLHVLQPAPVNDAALIATSVPEDDAPEWSAGTAYPVGARVLRGGTHRIYESGSVGNVGNDPVGASGKWTDIGPTNRWAMFDQALGSVTSSSTAIAVTLNVSSINAVALLDVKGDAVRVQAPGYDRTVAPNSSGSATFLDLPQTTGQITVRISGPAEKSVGTLLVGSLVSLGSTEDSPKTGITDFSLKEPDEFGDVTIVERAWSKRMSVRAMIRTDGLDLVAGRIAAVRARPSLWIGKEGLESLTIYGFCKEASIAVDTVVSRLSLSIEGLSTAGKVEAISASIAWPDITDPLGTKPQDNADVTSENTSKDTAAVNGRPAGSVNLSLDINTQGIIEQALRQDNAALVLNARTFVNNQPISTTVLNFIDDQSDVNKAALSSLKLLGAKSPDGTAWIMDLDHVYSGNGKTLSQELEEVGVTNGETQIKVTQLMEAVINADGSGVGRALMRIDNGGKVIGFAMTNDGTVGALKLVIDQLYVEDPNDGNPLLILSYGEDNILRMLDVEINKLAVNSVTTKNLQLNNVTNKEFAYFNFGGGSASAVGANGNTWADLGLAGNKVKITTKDNTPIPAGSQATIRAYLNCQRTGGNNDRINLRLWVHRGDGSSYQVGDTVYAGMSDFPAILTYEWADEINFETTYEYRLQIQIPDGSGTYFGAKMILDLGKR